MQTPSRDSSEPASSQEAITNSRRNIKPTEIGRDDVRRLVAECAQLVDVPPAQEYHDLRLRGTISIPPKELTAEATADLHKDQPVIVHCYDYQSDMSLRAAWRLERLGFTDVYDYTPGEAAPAHTHEENHIVCIRSGWMRWTVGNETMDMAAGYVVVTPAGI